jgi:hypothetical protein
MTHIRWSASGFVWSFKMRAEDVILVLRWPDRRSATTIGIALMWGVDWCTPIMHQCGESPALTLSFIGFVPVGTYCVLLSNWVVLIMISYNYWFDCIVLSLNYLQEWFNCCNYLCYWVNHNWTVIVIGTDREFSIDLCISNQLPRFL